MLRSPEGRTHIFQLAHHVPHFLFSGRVNLGWEFPKCLLDDAPIIRHQVIHTSKCLVILFSTLQVTPSAELHLRPRSSHKRLRSNAHYISFPLIVLLKASQLFLLCFLVVPRYLHYRICWFRLRLGCLLRTAVFLGWSGWGIESIQRLETRRGSANCFLPVLHFQIASCHIAAHDGDFIFEVAGARGKRAIVAGYRLVVA